MDLVVEIYRLTNCFPKTEAHGLASQMNRASVSIPSNIAEGYRRRSRQEYLQFLRIAFGSGAELETQLAIAIKLGFTSTEDSRAAFDSLNSVMKMLNRLIHSLSVPTPYTLHPTPDD